MLFHAVTCHLSVETLLIASGKCPDLYLSVGRQEPINYGLLRKINIFAVNPQLFQTSISNVLSGGLLFLFYYLLFRSPITDLDWNATGWRYIWRKKGFFPTIGKNIDRDS